MKGRKKSDGGVFILSIKKYLQQEFETLNIARTKTAHTDSPFLLYLKKAGCYLWLTLF